MKGYPVHYERQRHRTETSRRDKSNIVPKRLAKRFWCTKYQSSLLTNFRVSVALPFGARTHLPSNYLVTKKLFLYSFATSLLRRIRLGLQVMPADLVLMNNRARSVSAIIRFRSLKTQLRSLIIICFWPLFKSINISPRNSLKQKKKNKQTKQNNETFFNIKH